MRLSFSTNAFVRYSLFEAVEQIAKIGYQGVEILADAPHFYADSVTSSDLHRLRTILDRTGLRVANINANTAIGYYGRNFWEPLFEPSLANPDRKLRQWRIDYTKKCIDIAEFLGAECVSITSGRSVPGVLPDESMDFLYESLRSLLDYAQDKSVLIGVEYEPGLLIERIEELEALVTKMDSPFLGVNLDLGHSHLLGEDPETVISCLAKRIFHIHIADIRGQKHYHLIPGTGDVDWEKLLSILHRHRYEGFATVELYTYPHQPGNAARRAFCSLQNLMRPIQCNREGM